MYEVFPGSISKKENWTDSVHNHDNEHVFGLSNTNALFHILANEYLVLDQARQHAHPVCA